MRIPLLAISLMFAACSDVLDSEQLKYVPEGFVSPLEKIFLINLDRSPDRLAFMQKQFGKTSLTFERFKAIEGKLYREKYRQKIITDDFVQTLDADKGYSYLYDGYRRESGLVPGEIGCYLSHYEILKSIVDDNIGVALVLEDDAVLPKDFDARLLSILAHAPESWDMIYLFHQSGVGLCHGTFPRTPDRRFVDLKNSGCIAATTGYLVSNQGAQKLIQHAMPASTTIDAFITEEMFTQKHGPFFAYAAYPQVLSIGDFSATIELRSE